MASVLVATGCGGSPPRGAESASHESAASTGPAGAAELAGDTPADILFSVDLAGMRKDPTLSKVLEKANASAKPDIQELMAKIDRIDLRASGSRTAPDAVVVLWGHLPKEPSGFAAFAAGSRHAFTADPALASGVREYESSEAANGHLFVVNDGVWVVGIGAPVEKLRARFAASAAPPKTPASDLLHVDAKAAALLEGGRPRGPFGKLTSFDITLRAGMASVKGLLHFEDEDAAKGAEAQIKLLTSLLLVAASEKAKDCVALEKLGFDVARDGAVVDVEVRGLAEAAAAWDPAKCPKLGEKMDDEREQESHEGENDRAPAGKPGGRGHRKK